MIPKPKKATRISLAPLPSDLSSGTCLTLRFELAVDLIVNLGLLMTDCEFQVKDFLQLDTNQTE
jgi:hypothetical protein